MNHSYTKNVVIIGGGPAGLGTALMLAKRGWQDITVIEKRPSADYYEPDKSFSYQIDGRGQKLTDLLELTDKLAELSVPNTDFYLTIIQKDGKRQTKKLPIADANRKTAYWVPRADFMQLLYQEMQQFPSPSSGLRYKVLTLPPQFPLSEKEGDVTQSSMAYAIRSRVKGRKKVFSLGLLPLKNTHQPRTANIITYPDHQIWQLKTTEEVKQFLTEAFSQLPLEKIISFEEITRFANSKGGVFPIPQFCSGLFQIFGNPDDQQGTGVILLGDAAHCFPPDIGQGVNSALEDIYVFQETLNETQDNLSQALPSYQTRRQADIKALIDLVQVSFPWQYNQAPLRKKLWSLNFLSRLLLNRLFPSLFNPHSFLLLQNEKLSYSEIWTKSNQTTQRLFTLGGLALLIILIINLCQDCTLDQLL